MRSRRAMMRMPDSAFRRPDVVQADVVEDVQGNKKGDENLSAEGDSEDGDGSVLSEDNGW